MSNPFATEEAWNVSTGEYLPSGNHLVKVDSIEPDHSSKGNPQFVIEVSNAQGSKTNWLTVTPQSIGGVINFTDACGLDRPTDEQVETDAKSGFTVPTLAYMQQAVGKSVGVVIRDEDKWDDPTKKVAKVQGYVTPDRVGGSSSDVPTGNAPSHSPNGPGEGDLDIPF